jgi:hypothetical protein
MWITRKRFINVDDEIPRAGWRGTDADRELHDQALKAGKAVRARGCAAAIALFRSGSERE